MRMSEGAGANSSVSLRQLPQNQSTIHSSCHNFVVLVIDCDRSNSCPLLTFRFYGMHEIRFVDLCDKMRHLI
jgi:hypothetical protein